MNGTNGDWEQLPADLRRAAEAALCAPRNTPLLARTRPGRRPALCPGIVGSDSRAALGRRYSASSACGQPSGRRHTAWAAYIERHTECAGYIFRPLVAAPGGHRLAPKDQTGTGRLELLGPDGLLYTWRYTIGRSPAAHRLADRFERLRQGELSGGEGPAEPPTVVCPSCGVVLAADQGICPDCGSVKDKPALGALLPAGRPSPGRTNG